MNIVDIIILILIISGGITGAKNGFFKQTVMLVGTIICFILAWLFKDIIANFLSYNLPFLNLNGLVSLNIVLYQLLAFIILLAILFAVLVVLTKITGIFEKILKFTIVLGIPSKILGFIVGMVEAYVIVFVCLFFLTQPAFSQELLEDSKLTPLIVNSSPGLSNVVENTNRAISDIYDITKDYSNGENSDELNHKIYDVLLKHKVVDKAYLNKLNDKGKIVYS